MKVDEIFTDTFKAMRKELAISSSVAKPSSVAVAVVEAEKTAVFRSAEENFFQCRGKIFRVYSKNPGACIVGHHDLDPKKACPCIENVAQEYAALQPE